MRESPSDILRTTFRGLTPGLVGICAGFLVFKALFSWAVATALYRDEGIRKVAEIFVRVLAADTLRFLPLFAGIAAFNLARGPVAVRVGACVLALALGTSLAMYGARVIDESAWAGAVEPGRGQLSLWLIHSSMPALFTMVLLLLAGEADARRALDRQRIGVLELDRGLAEARLKVAQAQIEPHFLFNTLANIRRLYAIEPPSGKTMLRHFVAMLQSALPAMRDARSTFGQEIAHVTAYLCVQQVRMGKRLAYSFDVPEELHRLEFPPMMLLTLVENAIKHGIGPLREGGAIRIEAEYSGEVLRVRVTDTGRGLNQTSGTGIGLANIEARLRAGGGPTGRLVLEDFAGGGVSATIDVPASVRTA